MKYTTTQAAEKLGVSRSWLRHLIRNGKLAAEKMGRDWHIDQGALAQLEISSETKMGRPRGGGRMD